ncbi:N-acetylmuramic acid 6-phosphate etherase [Cytobacillus suaedae]|nr:N-acetylmuramic acid 6-phosphate etherase [Cytobacillus suaedae]
MSVDLSKLTTELRNDDSMKIDQSSTLEVLQLINKEDRVVADAVQLALPQIAKAVDAIYQSLKNGGRLFYVGAGTSGRLGVIDAAECPPTFSTDPDLVQAIIAGGEKALLVAVEGAEDDEELGVADLKKQSFSSKDVIVGIAASGRTPYVIGALQFAKGLGAETISLSCNLDSEISKIVNHPIEVITGAEVVTGSTRLKAATAQKMVLNMLSTTVMIKLGKVYENLMVDVKASNQKLIERAKNIVMTVTKADEEMACEILEKTNYEVKPAIVMINADVTYEEANRAIDLADGMVRKAINIAKGE